MRIATPNWYRALDSKTKLRLRRTAVGALDYLLIGIILCGFAAIGTVSYDVPLLLFGVALVVNPFFLIAIATGFSRRWQDPAMTAAQVVVACAVNIGGLMLAPQIAYLFVLMLFVPLSYGSLHFKARTYLMSWTYLSCALGLVIMQIGDWGDIATSTSSERFLFWLVVVVALGRFMSINAEVSRLRARLKEKNDSLRSATQKLAEHSSRDELTGIWNRREFMRLLQEEARRSVRNKTDFCVAKIEIDRFGELNDQYGYLVGDALLHELGQLLEFSRRATDSLARYGGAEFALLLQGARLSTSTVALERTRNLVARHDWEAIAPGLKLTVSSGIAAWHPGDTLSEVMKRADIALHEARDAGFNCVRTLSK